MNTKDYANKRTVVIKCDCHELRVSLGKLRRTHGRYFSSPTVCLMCFSSVSFEVLDEEIDD